MGYREDIEALDLADDVKQKLLESHEAELDPLLNDNKTLKRISKKESVKAEIAQLSDMGFSPGQLKFVRRVFLSDDEEPGTILLSDTELELSGEEATGARNREEMSVAGALRHFIELMPKDEEGKIQLGDQLSGENEDITNRRPPNGDPDDPDEKARQRAATASRLAGKTVTRSGKRYGRVASDLE